MKKYNIARTEGLAVVYMSVCKVEERERERERERLID